MVGHPKRLSDLDRIEAGVKITCRRCKRERLVSRERLMRDLTSRGLNPSWREIPRYLRCPCGAKDATIVAMPFTRGDEDGEMLFEALLRAYERFIANAKSHSRDAEWRREASDTANELHHAQVRCERGSWRGTMLLDLAVDQRPAYLRLS